MQLKVDKTSKETKQSSIRTGFLLERNTAAQEIRVRIKVRIKKILWTGMGSGFAYFL